MGRVAPQEGESNPAACYCDLPPILIKQLILLRFQERLAVEAARSK